MSTTTQTDQLQRFADFARDFAVKAQALAAGEATASPHEVYHGARALIGMHEAALSDLARLRAVEASARAYVAAADACRARAGHSALKSGEALNRAEAARWEALEEKRRAEERLRAVLKGQR